MRLSITPAGGGVDTAPNRGITVRAAGGRISKVIVRTGGDPVVGRLNAAATVWRSTWALNVSQHYTVTATATGTSGNAGDADQLVSHVHAEKYVLDEGR